MAIPKGLDGISDCDVDRADRTGGNAATATGAAGAVDLRPANAARLRAKTQGARLAAVFAAAAHDAVDRQTGLANLCSIRPGRLAGLAQQGLWGAGLDTQAAKSAAAAAEIDGGKAAIATDDDPLWAGALTVTASTATLNKLCLRQCPRRPQWRLPTTPEATAAIYRISPIHAASHRWPPDGG